jgi:hypothetical protein
MSKYKNKKVAYKNILFDSKKEMNHFIYLENELKKGNISDLKTQVRFELIPKTKQFRAVHYIADFAYKIDNKLVVEDVKGYKKGSAYAMFKLKQKLMYYMLDIEVIEI